jgi:hypothetical protein
VVPRLGPAVLPAQGRAPLTRRREHKPRSAPSGGVFPLSGAMPAVNQGSPPRYATPRALALPRCVREHREHISLRRLKVFSSCGKGPSIGLLSCKHDQFGTAKRAACGVPLQGVCCREVQMNIASIFDWFAQDSAYAAEHTDEPRQRGRRPRCKHRTGWKPLSRRHFVRLHLI